MGVGVAVGISTVINAGVATTTTTTTPTTRRSLHSVEQFHRLSPYKWKSHSLILLNLFYFLPNIVNTVPRVLLTVCKVSCSSETLCDNPSILLLSLAT